MAIVDNQFPVYMMDRNGTLMHPGIRRGTSLTKIIDRTFLLYGADLATIQGNIPPPDPFSIAIINWSNISIFDLYYRKESNASY